MTLAQVKDQIGIQQLELNTAEDKDGNKTDWMRHWDNDNRVAVSIHKELIAEIKSNSNIASLGVQKEKRTGEQGDYTAIRIVKYSPAEETL